MERRDVVTDIGTGVLVGLAGCSGGLPGAGPPDLRVVNYDDADHALSVTVRRDGGSEPLLDRTYEIPANDDRTEDRLFERPGSFRTSGVLDGEAAKTFTWTVDEVPVGGGFRLVVESDGTFHDDVVGSP